MKGEKFLKPKLFEPSQCCNKFSFRGLKNDSTAEVFELKHKTFENEEFPVMYIQVIPLLSYGPSFNFSIWFVELLGIEDDFIVCNTLQNYNEQKEKMTVRLILKHLRSKGHFEAFDALSKETKIQLEDPEITCLYQYLVDAGDFGKTEEIMEKLINGMTYFINTNNVSLKTLLSTLQKETWKNTFQNKNTRQNSWNLKVAPMFVLKLDCKQLLHTMKIVT